MPKNIVMELYFMLNSIIFWTNINFPTSASSYTIAEMALGSGHIMCNWWGKCSTSSCVKMLQNPATEPGEHCQLRGWVWDGASSWDLISCFLSYSLAYLVMAVFNSSNYFYASVFSSLPRFWVALFRRKVTSPEATKQLPLRGYGLEYASC